MTPPVPGWEQIRTQQPVFIPDALGEDISQTIMVDVPAWLDPESGEIFLDGDAREKMEEVKARHLGILAPHHLKAMREAIGLSQMEMARLLQLGLKSWTRWESGNARPSRSMNILLCGLYDGRLPISYLRSLANPDPRNGINRWRPFIRKSDGDRPEFDDATRGSVPDEPETIAA